MSWTFSFDAGAYDRAAGHLLRADPVLHTVPLTLLESALIRPVEDELYGWWTDADGAVAGTVSHTPSLNLLLGIVPELSMQPLVTQLLEIDRRPPGVSGPSATAAQFAVLWASVVRRRVELETALRLFRLGPLQAATAPGQARVATEADTELLIDWYRGFDKETHGPMPGAERKIADRLSYGGLTLWEDPAGVPVSMAGHTRPAAGVSRVAPVYTPTEYRRHGYAAAVTTAVSVVARQVADEVVLFTDLTNPTSNAIYQRLGYEPVIDSLMARFLD